MDWDHFQPSPSGWILPLTYSVGDGEENLEEREQEYDVEGIRDNVQEINDKAKARMKFKVS